MGHFMDDQEIEGHAKTRATGRPAAVYSVRLDDVLRIVGRWEKASFLHLSAGEMTAQETRTAIAVVRAIKAELTQLFQP